MPCGQKNIGLVTPASGTSAAPVPVTLMHERTAPSHRDPPLTKKENTAVTEPSHIGYPPEYDPFDRPVDEVITQLFDNTQPVNPPPAKKQR